MAFLSFRNSPKAFLTAASAALLVPLIISSQGTPQPSARLEPARLAVSLAHDAAPVDLTTTLSNAGTAPLDWRIGAIRDVTPEAAPAVASGPVASAKLYAKANLALENVTGEIIVALKPPAGAAASAAAAAAPPSTFLGGRCKVKKELAVRARHVKGGKALKLRAGRRLLLVSVEDRSKAGLQKAIDDLRKDPSVAYAEPNYRVKAVGMPDDPHFPLLYGLHNSGQTGGVEDADIDAPEAWDTHTGDGNVVVGVIDTGIDYLHPDLSGNMWTNPGEIPGNGLDDDGNGYVDDVHGYDFVNDDPDPMDDHYHGTHVAGTIAGDGNNGIGVTGVAWKAKVAALKFLDAFGSGSTDDAIEAVAYANAMNIPITNNSWGGGGFSQALKDVIDAAGERGFLFVAAAGNSSSDNDRFPSYPSGYDSENIIAVAATDHRDALASFSSYGATTVDLGAPGVDIYSAAPRNEYQYLSGTSMATPHVAGAAALLRSYNPQLGGAEIKAALLAGVDPIPSLAGRTLTGGRLNLAKAIAGVNPPWLTMAPKGPGTLAPGASQVLTATVDPRGLVAGEHRALVTIPTNDPARPGQELEVVATIGGCKSLAVSPASLDFGPVWMTTTRRLSLTLRNACNDYTTVSAVESSQGEFSAPGTFPMRVPPFGTAAIEVAYSPVGLGQDAGVLTLRSDAADHPVLTVAVRGAGIEPPRVSASPGNFEVTLDPAERAVRALTVSNTGGDDLAVDLRVARPAAARQRSASARVIPGKSSGKAWATRPAGRLAGKLKPDFRPSAAGLRVLYLNTLHPDGFDDQFITGLRGLANVGTLETLDGSMGTPNADYLMGYDVVVVASNRPWADARGTGDALADYVDAGGAVALLTAAIASGGGYALQGRIVDPAYMPIAMAGAGRGGDAVEFENHPITAGLTLVSCFLPTSATATQGRGLPLGRYPSGNLLGAVNPDQAVVAINVYPEDFYWGGDFMLMMGNTLDHLSGAGNWLKVQPRNAVIPPGGSREFTVEISADRQIAGDHESALEIVHNAPAGDNPLRVPVLMHVRPVSRLALSTSKHDFGGVLVGGNASTVITLNNTGNRATTVSGVTAEGDFSAASPAPLEVPAFGSLEVTVRYTPREEGDDLGGLIFTSDASDHPVLRLALRGKGLPSPLATLAPERLEVALAHDAPPRDLTAILSNGGRGPLQYQVTSVRDADPAPAAARALAVQAERIYRAANYDLPAVPGELIVGLKEGSAGFANATALGGAGILEKRAIGRAKSPKGRAAAAAWKLPRKLVLVSVADASKAGMLRAIEALRKDPNVAYAEPNYRVKAVAVPDDPDFGLLWGMHNSGQTGGLEDADIDAPEAWDVHTGDGSAVVGVIDTGIDWLHPDLAANIWTNPGEVAGNGLDDDGNGFVDDVHGYDFVNKDGDPMDDHYHGTHCAGTIAGAGNNGTGVAGVAWKARLAGLKFLDASGFGDLDDAIEAVAYANAMGIPITSNSWGGGGFSQGLKDVIDAGGALGYLFIAAAGNDGSDNDAFPSYPSGYDSENIIAVAATDHMDEKAGFTNYGAVTVDLGAPGVDIYSAAPGAGYQYLSGTSMATPHVSGAAALLKSYNPSMGGAEIKAAILAGVDPIPALAGQTVTGGRLNIAKALGLASPPWLTVSPRAPGVLQPGTSQALTATVDPKGLTAGLHRGIATIVTNDPAHPELRLEVAATVSACRTLSVSPASLDHGAVWLGSSRRQALVLTNACNDQVTLSAVEISHKAFKSVTALPLAVPAFGSAVLEIEYVPDDLKADKANLTLRSDAQDHPVLKVTAKGTGVKPPSIEVAPAQVTLTMDPSEQKRSVVKVSNKGGADLVVSLSARPDRSQAARSLSPRLTVGERKQAGRYARFQASLKPLRIHPLVRSTAEGLKVLYLTTLLQPEGGDMFTQGLRGLPQVAALDVLDGSINTPNADYLKAYDVVVVSSDWPWADPVATGDALADYVDDGGRVTLLVAAIASGGGYELQGRMGSPDYMPMAKAGPGSYGVASTFADHPITQGLAAIECYLPTASTETQGGAFALGNYDNGALLGAVHAEKAVTALNVFPGDYAWAGDVILMMSNTLDYLATFSNWVRAESRQLTVPAGKSAEAGLLFDTEGLEAGTYTGSLRLAHNVPSGANPLTVPVTLTVKARNCLEASVVSIDFGKVWSGRSASATVELSNPCNRPTAVKSFAASPSPFRTSAAPMTLPPFSKASIEVSFTPADLKRAKGELVIKSDAKDHPQIRIALAGAGVKPPSISVKPASLSITMDPAAKAERTVEITNAGGDTLRVEVSTVDPGDAAARPKGRLIPGTPATLRPLVGEGRTPLPYTSPRGFRAQSGSHRVLYVHTIWMPDSGNADQFTQGLRALPNVESVDLLDARFQTPDVNYLLAYDIVVVAADWSFADPVMLGDVLADFVDAGGKVVLTSTAYHIESYWGLGGRIVTPEYLPVERNWSGWDANNPSLQDHPINEGVASFSSLIYIESFATQGAGQSLGTYSNGALTGGFNPDKPVVALNVFPLDGYWGGDVLLLMGNAFDWLGGSLPWLKPAVNKLAIPPGKSRKLTLSFDTHRMLAGAYQGILALEHNAPAAGNPLNVPVTLTVKSKRCLAAEPKSLDFGDTWKNGTATGWTTLVNNCNEPTEVSGFRSPDPAFAARTGAPLTVPAFGSADLEISFRPPDTRTHRSSLEVTSNAQDDKCLAVALTGRGIRPPDITVNPSSFNESLAAGESVTRSLTVGNPGGDTLEVILTAQDGAAGAGDSAAGNPVLAKGRAKSLVAPWSGRLAAVTSLRRAAGGPAAKAEGLRVLYFNTLLPDSATDYFTDGLRSLPQVGSLDLLDGTQYTPNADWLAQYDAVIVAASSTFADAVAAGDALADYVDRGGWVCLMTAAISNWEGLGLGGRIATEAYMPMTMEGPGKGGMIGHLEDHPINRGVNILWNEYPTASTSTQGDGMPLGTLENGILLGAYHARKAVVALNVFPADWGWKGDLIPMMGNILDHLSGFRTWLGVSPRSLRVPPGGSAQATVTFDGSKAPGGVNQARLEIVHNSPLKSPVTVPATLEVAGLKALALSATALEFKGTVLGDTRAMFLTVANAGNLPVTVEAARNGSPDFSFTGAAFPLDLEPGADVRLEVTFVPTSHGDAAGSLEFSAAGAGAPQVVSLSGRGLRPAELRASTLPDPLRFTVAAGGQASGTLRLENAGDVELGYLLDLRASTGPAAAAARPAYGPEHHEALKKGALDTRVGNPVDLSSGGPDAHGHRWFDSDAEGGPAFAWTDISTTGRLLEKVSGCDDCAEEAKLSFPFPFYRTAAHRTLFVSSNGYVTFGKPSSGFSNHPLPSASMPGDLVAALYQDLYPAGGGAVWFQDFGDRAVVQYQDVPDFQGTGRYDFQIVLHADGVVDFLYKSLTGARNTATVGIQNGAADDGLEVVYNADYLHDSLAVRVRTWVTAPARAGVIEGQDGRSLPVSLDSRGLAPGTYTGLLGIPWNHSRGTENREVPVELIVTPAPAGAAR